MRSERADGLVDLPSRFSQSIVLADFLGAQVHTNRGDESPRSPKLRPEQGVTVLFSLDSQS